MGDVQKHFTGIWHTPLKCENFFPHSEADKYDNDERLKITVKLNEVNFNPKHYLENKMLNFMVKVDQNLSKLVDNKIKEDSVLVTNKLEVLESKAEALTAKMNIENNGKEADFNGTNMKNEASVLDEDKIPRPKCLNCFVKFTSTTKIAQCLFGHWICWSCKERDDRECGMCGQPMIGIAFGLENHLKEINN